MRGRDHLSGSRMNGEFMNRDGRQVVIQLGPRGAAVDRHPGRLPGARTAHRPRDHLSLADRRAEQPYASPRDLRRSMPLSPAPLAPLAAGLSVLVVELLLLLRRFVQAPGLIEYGKVRFHGLQLVDAVVFDPSNGASAPLVSARLHS